MNENKPECLKNLLNEYEKLEESLKMKDGKSFDLIDAIISGTISGEEIDERCRYENEVLDKMDKLRYQMNGMMNNKKEA